MKLVINVKELSAGVLLGWQVAAIETSIAKHQFIEKEQIMIGICSLEKVFMSRKLNLNFYEREITEVKFENESIKSLLSKYKLTSTSVRRELRKNFGQGNFKHTEKVIHRSENCKEFFKHAELLAENSDRVSSLHLFAAILENPEGVIKGILEERDIKLNEMREKALFFARVSLKGGNNDSYVI